MNKEENKILFQHILSGARIFSCWKIPRARSVDLAGRRQVYAEANFAEGKAEKKTDEAFTLIETLVAISLLSLAIVAPMSLTTQSLSSAYYARDQMTAFHLAQEAIESVRAARDENILTSDPDMLAGIPTGSNVRFVIDTRDNEMTVCDQGDPTECPYLRTPTSPTDPAFYAYRDVNSTQDIYATPPGWADTKFRRTILAEMISGSNNDELEITVIVSWQTGSFQLRTITMRENLYRWIDLN